MTEELQKIKSSRSNQEEQDSKMNMAPTLKWNGDKWNNKGPYNKTNKQGYYFYQLPVPIMTYICETLDGKNGLMLKIMMVLIGTDEGFGLSEKFVCERIGIEGHDKARSYYRAREELNNMNWIWYDKKNKTITLNYDFLWDEAFTEKEYRTPVLEIRKDPDGFSKYIAQ